MKKLALFIFAVSLAAAQSVNVQKTSGTNEITGSLVIGSGKTLTATGNGTIVATSAASVSGNVTITSADTLTVNGAFTGTPTSGTLSLANLTLTLPASPTFAGVWTGAQGGTGVANTGKIITLGGNVTTVGAFNLGLSLTGNTAVTLPLTGTLVGSADTGTVTNAMLAGSIANSKLGNSTITLGTTSIALGSTSLAPAGLTSLGTNAVTAATGQSLTLTGGDTGASITLATLGAGNPLLTLTPKGTGYVTTPNGYWHSTATALSGGYGLNASGVSYLGIQSALISSTKSAIALGYTATPMGAITPIAHFVETGNVLIGTTTDISGSAGLKVAGTTAATNNTSGAVQIGSNIGLSGNSGGPSYFGGNGNFAGTTSASSSTTGTLTIGNGTAATNVAIGGGNINAGGTLTIGSTVIHTLSATPASASAAGTVGTISWDSSFIYICVATNTWKRVAIATW